jgi:predicted metal-dependent phosphoesterase TrpH|tara:strand:- start:602 stop:1429 length:828 start_codon:yes stop_codon:yes gene_type:complete
MTCYDLHSHSTVSDGSLSPEHLVARAIDQGVDVLALTDHDGTEGITAAQAAAQGTKLSLVTGVEISVTWGSSTIHILGLKVDHKNEALQKGLKKIRDYRKERAFKIAERLEKSGISGAYEGASQYASPVMLGRVHFAKFLVDKGHAKNINDVFKRYLVRNKPGYVSGEWATLAQAVNWINGAGGQAVIAHPARYKMTATKLRRLITEFKELGGVGLEVVSGRQHPEEIKTLAKLANDFNLLASCGSDFHSPDNTWVELGRLPELPSSVNPIWKKW